MLNLDSSLFVVVVLVWLLLMVLDKLYFKPVGKIIDERETKIKRESSLIESMTDEIEEKTRHIENVLKDARRESGKIKEELIKKGEEVREKIASDARRRSRQRFELKMKDLDSEIAEAEKKLVQEIGVFSEKMKEIFIG